jgi:hypothetical protein
MPTEIVDLTSLVYTQTPECYYAYTDAVVWTDLTTFITQDGDFVINVYGNDVAVAGASVGSQSITHTISVQNTITITSNGPAGSSTFNPIDSNDKVTQQIEITNPCWTTTYASIVYDPDPASVEFIVQDGSTGSINFNKPSNQVEVDTGIPLICGETNYGIFADTSDTALQSVWATIAETNIYDQYSFDVDTTVDITLIAQGVAETVKTVYVKATLADYPNIVKYTQLDIKITAIACDCSHLAWSNPTIGTPTVPVGSTTTVTIPSPVADKSAETTISAFANCYNTVDDCLETGAF